MSKPLTLIVGILAISNVLYSFWANQQSEKIFGLEMNIWVYRLIWTALAIGIFYDYFKKKKINE